MSNDLKIFSSSNLNTVVQALRELLSQSHLAFLLGAGCSRIAGLPLMPDLTEEVVNHSQISKQTKEFLSEIRKNFSGSDLATIEDYMSETVDLLSIAERRLERGAKKNIVTVGDKDRNTDDFNVALNEIKCAIASVIMKKEVDISTHRKFIRAIHTTLPAKMSLKVN